MQHLFAEFASSPDLSALWDVASRAARAQGADKFSYHFTPMFASQTSSRTRVKAEGFSLEWLDLYKDADFRRIDPIPDAIMRSGKVLSWADALDRVEPSPEVNRYIEAMRAHGITNGLGVPLYGPDQRDAYAAFGFPEDVEPSAAQIANLSSIARSAHDRVCQLVRPEEADIALSQRESQVLTFIAQGHSNREIAGELGISAETVSTYVRRLYEKLDVSDRVGATVKALKLKLITL